MGFRASESGDFQRDKFYWLRLFERKAARDLISPSPSPRPASFCLSTFKRRKKEKEREKEGKKATARCNLLKHPGFSDFLG